MTTENQPRAGPAWHTVTAAEAVARLESEPERGLSESEAAARLERYGANRLPEERETPVWKLILRQFQDPLIYILLVAAAVVLVLGHHTDFGVILVVVVLNAIVGFTQEARAQRAMRALASMAAPRAEVVRQGRIHQIESGSLVPGDVITLTAGDRIQADVRLLQARELEVDESALTGESLPVVKSTEPLEMESLVPGDQVNMGFSGSVITRGRGRGVVVRTGEDTEIGLIAAAVRSAGQTRTPLQERMHRFGRVIGVSVVGLSLLVVAIGLLQGMAPADIFLAAVALAVASIPEGLPVVLTVTLAIGVSRMARRQAIIRSLPAVETLGSTTVIGSDKTGTLTKNEMTVRFVHAAGTEYELTGVGYSAEGRVTLDGAPVDVEDHPALREALIAGVLANEADAERYEAGEAAGDPTEIALHVAATKAGLTPLELRRRHPELDILPFESERRFMATLNAGDEGHRIHLKGAPEVIISRCDRELGSEGEVAIDAESIQTAAAAMAARGLRVLATAYRAAGTDGLDESRLASGFVFAGLQGLEDPLRPEAIEAVERAHAAGIRVVMLTGDHGATAAAIGGQLGLDPHGEGAIEGVALEEMSDEELDVALERINVFARVAPEHKLRVVQRLKRRGEVVAVTGDGVNDAPALRAAHLGIAMGRSGTDVAREASDMVLADDNFATITAAVEEGRVVFSNVRKVTFFLLSTAVGQILVILTAVVLDWPLPLVAAQILWVNVATNGLQDLALAFEPGEPGLLDQRPRAVSEGIVNLRIIERLFAVGIVLAVGTLGMFWWTLDRTGDIDLARTAALTQLVVFQFFHVFNCRSLDRSILSVPLLSNPFLFLSVVAAFAAHLAALHLPFLQAVFRTVPLDLETWGIITLIATTVILGGELDKWRNRRMGRGLS